MSTLRTQLTALFKKPEPQPERTRLHHFFKLEDVQGLFKALDNYEIVMSSKQMDWADDLSYRYELYGMKAYCSENDKAFLLRMMERMKTHHVSLLNNM